MSNQQYNEIIIYQDKDGIVKVDVRIQDDTLWLTQLQIAELFGVKKAAISKHLTNIFNSGELDKNAVVSKMETTASDGKTYDVLWYNLDAIIAVGYRVNSKRATAFRIWATNVLKEYLIKGFALDDNRLKELGGGYFKELLERIRDIRASEKVFYRQVLEIYATSIDYDPHAEVSVQFFRKVQNKIHYAVHGETAAEVIYHRADAEKELRAMGQIVSGYLDFAERQAEREIAMTMDDWAKHLDNILTMSGEQLLQGNGLISAKQAMEKAESEYKKYKARTLSDVEKDYLESIKLLENKSKTN